MLQSIENLHDVAEFTRSVVRNGVNLHPDDDFLNYINLKTGEPVYTKEEVEFLNQLMINAFEICEKHGVDIYGFMGEIFLQETGLDKIIPLPSEEIWLSMSEKMLFIQTVRLCPRHTLMKYDDQLIGHNPIIH